MRRTLLDLLAFWCYIFFFFILILIFLSGLTFALLDNPFGIRFIYSSSIAMVGKEFDERSARAESIGVCHSTGIGIPHILCFLASTYVSLLLFSLFSQPIYQSNIFPSQPFLLF